jgi:hypothetical protein
MMRKALATLMILCSISLGVWADAAAEIDHLLGFIGGSQCRFVRNGDEYDAPAARAHIERKYDYAKREIQTAEQFIEYTATKSSITGAPYRVICSGREEPSADWLRRELARFRAAPDTGSGNG